MRKPSPCSAASAMNDGAESAGLASVIQAYASRTEGGCPARIRTSIDGVRVRSLTIRRRGSLGPGGIESARNPVNDAPPDPSGLAPAYRFVIKPEPSQPPTSGGEGQERA